jgi:hypothetical protein
VTLQKPEYYIPDLKKLWERNNYSQKWKLQLVRKTNRHPETNGGLWGWYEIFPLEETVGYWSEYGKDDLKGINIIEWNREAEIVWLSERGQL